METKPNKLYAVLNWRRKGFGYPYDGYYCGYCSGYIGKDGHSQRYCPYCKAQIVGHYA